MYSLNRVTYFILCLNVCWIATVVNVNYLSHMNLAYEEQIDQDDLVLNVGFSVHA